MSAPAYPPTHLPTYSLTHLLTYPPTHLPTYSLTHLLTYPPTHLPTSSLTHLPPTHLLTCSLSNALVRAARMKSLRCSPPMECVHHCTVTRPHSVMMSGWC